MKRSQINQLVRQAMACFSGHGWTLPPNPRWDVTDFGLGAGRGYGLVLVNLAEEPEYCEKLMYARWGMTTPAHCHHRKKEDIIVRWGRLKVQLWNGEPSKCTVEPFTVSVNNEPRKIVPGETVMLGSGKRVRMVPGLYHEFSPESEECIIGEVSTSNDDVNDNDFVDTQIGRYPGVEEDEPALVQLLSDKAQ